MFTSSLHSRCEMKRKQRTSALTPVGGTVVLGATANLALAAFGHHVDVSVFIV